MTTRTEPSRLEKATDAAVLAPRLEAGLRRVLGAGSPCVESLCVTRVFPRSGGGLTIQYRMRLVGGADTLPDPVILCGHLLGPDEPVPAYAGGNEAFLIEEPGLVVPVFPFDPRLPAVAEVWSGRGARSILEGVGGHAGATAAGDDEDPGRELLGYRLEKRCVIRVSAPRRADRGGETDSLRVVVRILRPRRAAFSIRALRLLEENGFAPDGPDGLSVPRTIGADGPAGLHVLESAPGRTLHDLLGDERFEAACGAAGRLLRKLHAIRRHGMLAVFPIEEEVEALRGRAEWVRRLFPSRADRFGVLLERIEGLAGGLPRPGFPSCIHRDFFDKQVLHDGRRATLLDCDMLALGDPAQDFGNFVAHLMLRAEQAPGDIPSILGGVRAFEREYGSRDEGFAVRAAWWKAATLLRLGFLYALRPRWRRIADALLALADDRSQEVTP